MTLTTSPGTSQLAFMVAAARVPGLHVEESVEVRLGDDVLAPTRLEDPEHGITHLVTTPPTTPADGTLTLTYQASVEGDPAAAAAEAARDGGDLERLTYLRPSRYAESDRLVAMARSEFHSLHGRDLLNAVAEWVHYRLAYVPGASRHTDGAVETYLARAGVCRDFAHLVVALLRAMDVPARLVSVYAPGLYPMDFHAVAEAWVEGGWQVVDATRLAPRQSLVRIATGRDAADTAFLSTYGAPVRLEKLNVVVAIKEGDLPMDDGRQLVRLA